MKLYKALLTFGEASKAVIFNMEESTDMVSGMNALKGVLVKLGGRVLRSIFMTTSVSMQRCGIPLSQA